MVQTPHMFWLLFIKYMLVLVTICDASFILVSLCCNLQQQENERCKQREELREKTAAKARETQARERV